MIVKMIVTSTTGGLSKPRRCMPLAIYRHRGDLPQYGKLLGFCQKFLSWTLGLSKVSLLEPSGRVPYGSGRFQVWTLGVESLGHHPTISEAACKLSQCEYSVNGVAEADRQTMAAQFPPSKPSHESRREREFYR